MIEYCFEDYMMLNRKKDRLLQLRYPGFGSRYSMAARYEAVLNRVFKNKKIYRDEYLKAVDEIIKKYGGNHMTEKTMKKYVGYGRYLNNRWEISAYGITANKKDHYCSIKTRRENDPYQDLRNDLEFSMKYADGKFSYIRRCQLCDKQDSQKKIKYRNDVYNWDTEKNSYEDTKYCLCTSCWNKVKPIVKKEREAREIKRLTNKLNKVRLEQWQKLKQQQI